MNLQRFQYDGVNAKDEADQHSAQRLAASRFGAAREEAADRSVERDPSSHRQARRIGGHHEHIAQLNKAHARAGCILGGDMATATVTESEIQASAKTRLWLLLAALPACIRIGRFPDTPHGNLG